MSTGLARPKLLPSRIFRPEGSASCPLSQRELLRLGIAKVLNTWIISEVLTVGWIMLSRLRLKSFLSGLGCSVAPVHHVALVGTTGQCECPRNAAVSHRRSPFAQANSRTVRSLITPAVTCAASIILEQLDLW